MSRLLSHGAWRCLLECESHAELGACLRGSWVESAFTGETAAPLRKLRGELAAAEVSIARFLPRASRILLNWYNRRFDIENLKILLRSIHHGVDRARSAATLIPLSTSRLAWPSLLEARSIVELADRLRDTPYARPLEQAMERYQQEKRLFHLEVAMDLFYFQRLVLMIECRGGDAEADAREQLGRWIAVQNLVWAFRYRIYGHLSVEEILNYTLHRAFAVGLEAVRRVALGAPLAAEAQRLGFRLDPGRSEVEGLTELEVLVERERYARAASLLRHPIFRFGGVLAYLTLLECEIRDLGVIIEGRAAGLSRQDITARLLRAA
jgi:V/A-type H+-transporting ATPase subunit C